MSGMKLPVILCLLALCPRSAAAQCTMTTSITAGCGSFSPGNYSITVNTSGGTSPFTIRLYKSGVGTGGVPQLFQTVTNDVDGDFSSTDQLDHMDYQWLTVSVEVTDAVACVANAAESGEPYVLNTPFSPLLLSTLMDCSTGQSWITLWNVSTVCPQAPMSSIDGGTWQSFFSLWTSAGVSSGYRTISTYPPGSHTVIIDAHRSCSWQPPMGATLHESWANMGSITVPGVITPGDCGVNLGLRAALQGALPSGTLMHDSLRSKNLVPPTEPYSALGYSYAAYTGATSISPALLTTTGNNAIVDWVALELRNSANPAQVLFSKPALLQRDGDVVDLDGDSYVNFPSAGLGYYYIALRHRNHLGVMTSGALQLNATPVLVDLRLGTTFCHGTNARVSVGAVQCLWAGDANGDGTIMYTGLNNDRDLVLGAIGGVVPTHTLPNVYDRRDLNLDGTVKYTGANNDRDIILNNIGGVVPTNTRVQQLP